MTNKQLSPAAQAVLDAATLRHGCIPAAIAAAALRAAADQVLPETFSPSYPDDYESGAFDTNYWARIELLTIANELEGK